MTQTTAAKEDRGSDPRELLKAGLFLLQRSQPREAMRALEEASRLDPESPLIQSYLGLAMATARTGTKEAVQLCEQAVRGDAFQPELYLNLGRVYMIVGDKRRARLAFLEGLKLDREDPDLLRSLQVIGMRKLPPLPFLHRDSPVNKYLGIALRRLRLR
jgi:Flp pilus assembly protein TadD